MIQRQVDFAPALNLAQEENNLTLNGALRAFNRQSVGQSDEERAALPTSDNVMAQVNPNMYAVAQEHEVRKKVLGECPICHDSFGNETDSGDDKLAVICCGHVFHHSCIQRWYQECRKRSCPICRERITRPPVKLQLLLVDAEVEKVGALHSANVCLC